MATMNTNASINVSVKGTAEITALQNKLQQTTDTFGKLKTAIAGLALGNFIADAIRSAAALDDVSSATGIALENILGFSKAVKTFGGSFEGANTGVSRFANFLQSAVDGNKTAQDAFFQLGVSLDDLRKLSEADLLRKTIKGLGEMDKGSRQTALGMDIFGKSFATAEFDKINANIDAFTEKSRKQADAVRAAADAEERFGQATSALSNAVVQALRPLSDFIASIKPENLEKAASAIVAVATALGALYIASKAAVWAEALSISLARMAIAAGTSTGALSSLAAVLGLTSSLTLFKEGLGLMKDGLFGIATAASTGASVISRLGLAFGAFFSGLVRLIPIVGQVIAIFMVLNEAVALLTGSSIVEWGEKAAKAMGFIKETRKDAEEARLAQKKLNDEKANQVVRDRDISNWAKQQAASMSELVNQFDKQNEKSSKQLQLETELIGKSKEYQDLRKAQFRIDGAYQDVLDKLTESRDKLTAAEKRAGLGKDIKDEIDRVKKLKDAALTKAAADVKANNETERGNELSKFTEKASIDNAKKLKDLRDNIKMSTMSELDRKKYQIQLEAEAAGNEQANQEGLRRGLALTTTERQAYIDAAIKGSKALQDEAEREYNLSRQFETGWGNAFRQYVSDATNAAMKAQRIFQTLSQSLEDALYGFFTTGKFGWKQFADDIIKEMIRIETKQLAMSILTGGRGKTSPGSGLLGLGGLFGFLANGGPANANKPYIVGERGPELFVPNSSGTVVPNGAFGGGGNVTYNINAVDAMSFKQMIAADPTFLHAVAEQGRRRLPGAR